MFKIGTDVVQDNKHLKKRRVGLFVVNLKTAIRGRSKPSHLDPNHRPSTSSTPLFHTSPADYIANLCKKTFSSIANDPAHRLYSMLPFSGPSHYNLRLKRRFVIPKCRTERLKNSFLVRSCINNET
ncbi:hypothetical protein P5673_003666 [Acropora cervicornis]|uniref:Uncharacterized protein n=1 Tax=Acropora cervicornis TaxID=6130 RepID=A0AAD9R166_ACRCE|nr:hypothetical protein P5673_003666 [Acropora cervicornis]